MMRFLTFVAICCMGAVHAQNEYARYVNPMIGTGGHGHTFPGAATPFAMVQLSPDTRIDGSWDGCSGYHYSDSIIYGFSHTHLSGTGCSDYGDIAFMPSMERGTAYFTKDTAYRHRAATFSHANEKAAAGYYEVRMDNGIRVQLTSTTRVGLQNYTFSSLDDVWITLDLGHRDQLLEGKITQVSMSAFQGYRRSKAWAEDQLVYFYFELNREPAETRIEKGVNGDMRLHMRFGAFKIGSSLMIKTALSSVDEAGAKLNLQKELPHWDFEKVKKQASEAWNAELGRIKVYGGTETERTNFYTALYHCMMHPNIMNDVDGRYRGRDRQVHKAVGFNYYTVFSLWDTHRALHPLLNMIDKKRSHDFIMTFKAQFEQSGRLPMWELWGNETNCMIGFHSVSVILDAYVKGVITKEELKAIYPAVRAEAMSNRFGLDKFREKGYLEVEDESESVSKTLEYSYDMWCVSMIAKAIGSKDQYLFAKYDMAWRNLFESGTGFARPRRNGGWLQPFDPRQVNNHFTEANSWQYSFYRPHEIAIKSKLLDSMFTADSKTTGREQVDITGLIGQYAHGNEPSHNYIYLLDEPARKKYLKQVMHDFYTNAPDGLCGNDDCGQMSAWYVFSAMGAYPVCPGKLEYTDGVSLFDSVRVGHFRPFEKVVSNEMPGIGSMRSAPLIMAEKAVFSDSLLVTIKANMLWPDKIVFTLNQSAARIYTQPFYIHENALINAFEARVYTEKKLEAGFGYEELTDIATAHFYKRPNNYTIKINSTYNKQYTADGDEGLIDGLKGDLDWRKGRWQGYQGQDFEAIIDLQKVMPVKKISAGFLQDTRAWILLPKQVILYGSVDGVNYNAIGVIKHNIADTAMTTQRLDAGINNINASYRYIRIEAINYGKLPPWHPGRGEDAFIFIDEITIE